MFRILTKKQSFEKDSYILSLEKEINEMKKEKDLSYSSFERKKKEEEIKSLDEIKEAKKYRNFLSVFEKYFNEKYLYFFNCIVGYLQDTEKNEVEYVEKDVYGIRIKDAKGIEKLYIEYYYQESYFICNNQTFSYKIENAFNKLNQTKHNNKYSDSCLGIIKNLDDRETQFPYEEQLKNYEHIIDNLLFENIQYHIFDTIKNLNSPDEDEVEDEVEDVNVNKSDEQTDESSDKILSEKIIEPIVEKQKEGVL